MTAQPATRTMTRDERIAAVLRVLHRWKLRAGPDALRDLASEIVDAAAPDAGWTSTPHVTEHANGHKSQPRKTDAHPRRAWTPQRDTKNTRAKNSSDGNRKCSLCQVWKPQKAFRIKQHDPLQLTSRCDDCLKAAARGRYLSAKKLAALNAVRLELVADDETAGLRCLGCGQEIVVDDEIVCQAGVRHAGCDDQDAADG